MFPELAQEFRHHNYPPVIYCTLEKDTHYSENDQHHNVGEIELPFGTVEPTLLFKNLTKEGDQFQEINQDAKDRVMKVFSFFQEPKPISMAEQKELDSIEENENKKREHEAR